MIKRDAYKIHLNCERCGNPATILEIAGNALGNVFARCVCIVCNREFALLIDTRLVAENAARADVEAENTISACLTVGERDALLEDLEKFDCRQVRAN